MILNASEFADAVRFATACHSTQVRKGSDTPYIAHPLGVSALVIAHGGDQEQAIAALLHDVVEDCGVTIERLSDNFGYRVSGIVEACTDGVPDESGKKPPWRERKQAYLDKLGGKRADAFIVILADKVYNAESIVQDILSGDAVEVFGRFTGGPEGTAWYFDQLVNVFSTVPATFAPPALFYRLSEAAVTISAIAQGMRFGQAKEA